MNMATISEFISTSELFKILDSSQLQIIDIRPVEAYNGWQLKGEARGGHIKGARSLPFQWINYIDWLDIVFSKSIKKSETIIVYGYDSKESGKVAGMLIQAGFLNVRIYSDFLIDWVEDSLLPMEKLDRYQHLVYPEWVQKLIDGDKPQYYDNDVYKIVHAHYRNKEAYLSGHIPGAIAMDTNEVESTETWNRKSPAELKETFEKHGITADTTVVLYGKFMFPDNDDDYPGSSAGHIGAIRTALIMMWAGVKDVRVLNGGFYSWKSRGFRIDFDDIIPEPVENFGASIPGRPELIVDIDEAKEMLASEEAELVCVRSWPEYIGELSGYNYIAKKGRIPGAIFGNCGSDAYHMENYRNLDHSTREAREIEEIWENNNITPDKHLAFYCGTGWRGSEAFYNAWLLGWPRVSVFDGGWFEWSNDPANPFETGIP